MFRKLLLISWYIIVSILVLAAIVISIVRAYPSLYQHYLPSIQENISSIIDRPVQAGRIRIDWHGITPFITVNDLAIYSDDAKREQILFANKALLSIDVYNSLMQRKFNIHQLTLIGSNLNAVRTTDHRIILNGIDISETVAKRKQLSNPNKILISLLESTIAIKDEVKNLNYFFDRVNIILGFNKGQINVSSSFLLPETLGNSLMLVANVNDFDRGLNNIKGSLYTKGENINLELLSDFFPQFQVGVKAGTSDFEIWGDFESSLQRSFSGKLKFTDLEYSEVEKPISGIDAGEEITALETQFNISSTKDNWHLALIDSEIRSTDQRWPSSKYELNCTNCGMRDFSITSAFGYLNLTNLLSTLQHFPIFSGQLEKLLEKIQMAGVLHKSSVLTRWEDKQLVQYSYKSSLQDIAVFMPGQKFKVSSLTGELDGDRERGKIKIDATGMHIQADKLADHVFQDQKIVGTVNWAHADNGLVMALEDVRLEAEGLSANVQGSIQSTDGDLYLDLQAEVPQAQLAVIKTYFPYKKMRPKLSNWLEASMQAGTFKGGKLLFRGNPKYFPFKDQPGVFEAFTSVENGVLDYRNSWPSARDIIAEIKIKNKHLTANGHQGTILNSSIHHVTATIDDLKLPRLIIDGKANGPAEDIMKFLRQSALIPENSQIPKHILAGGNTSLDLNLILTLTNKLEKERTVNGVIEFDNTNLTVTSVALPFTNLTGKLKFDRNGAEGQGLNAKLYGSNFTAQARKSEGGRTVLTVMGDFNFDSYLANNHKQASNYISGIAPVAATINLPRFGKHNEDKSLEINIDSKLNGVQLALPEPLHKEIDEQKSLHVYSKYAAGKSFPLQVNFDNDVFMQAAFSEAGESIFGVEIRVGNNQFNPPEPGIKVSGKFDQLSVTEWLDIFQSSNKKRTLELNAVDIRAMILSVSGMEFKDVDFQLRKDTQHWLGQINSSVVKGKLSYPLNHNSTDIATGTFDYIRFNKPEKKTTLTFDPRTLPAMEIYTRQLEVNDFSFNEVALKTEPTELGMAINSLTGKGQDLQISANGAWEVGANNTHNTSFDIMLTTQNLHNSLTGLGLESGINKGQGSVTTKFNWPGAPYQFSVDSFSGTAKLRIKDGEISTVEPGAGRLIGLFNLGEISRRLSLDFTDFFSKGYVFDKIRGDLNFKYANLTTENLSVKGPSADIKIEGRTGIAAKDYDQVVTVTPHVSGGLPWIGLAVGGPLGAVGVIVGEKVAKTIGIDVDKVTQVKYSMTGSWDNPKIEPIANKVVKANTSPPGSTLPQHSPPNQSR